MVKGNHDIEYKDVVIDLERLILLNKDIVGTIRKTQSKKNPSKWKWLDYTIIIYVDIIQHMKLIYKAFLYHCTKETSSVVYNYQIWTNQILLYPL